jgi:hypothetical protein
LTVAGLIIQTLYYATLFIESVIDYRYTQATGTPGQTMWWSVVVGCESVLPAAALICLVHGRSRAGRVLVTLCAMLLCVDVGEELAAGPMASFFPGETILSTAAPVITTLLVAGAVLLAFHRDAPRAAAPGRWLGILAVSLPIVPVGMGFAQLLENEHPGCTWAVCISLAAHSVVSPIAPGVAVLVGISRAGCPVARSTVLLLLSVPVVDVAVPVANWLLGQFGVSQLSIGPDLLSGIPQELAWEAVVTQAILAAACWSALRRSGQLAPTAPPPRWGVGSA